MPLFRVLVEGEEEVWVVAANLRAALRNVRQAKEACGLLDADEPEDEVVGIENVCPDRCLVMGGRFLSVETDDPDDD